LKREKNRIAVLLACIVVSFGILIIDLNTPLGMAEWVLYLVPVLLAFRFLTRRSIVFLSSLCTSFMAIGFVFSLPGIAWHIALFNRSLGVVVLLLASMFIVERKEKEDALRESEAKYSALVEQAKDVVAIVQDGVIKFVNRAAEEVSGFEVQEIVGKPFMNWIAPESRNQVAERYKLRMTGEEVPPIYEAKIQRKDGAIKDIEVSAGVIQYNGKPADLAIARDVTERKRAEEQVKRLREYLQLQIERMPIGLIVWTPEFRVEAWNPAAEKIFGFTAEEALGKHPYDIIVPREAQPHVDDIWRRLLEGDMTAHSLNENVTKAGRTIICEWSNTPLRKADGTVTGVLSMVQDITERKRMEEELKRHSEHLEELVEERAKELCTTKNRLQFLLSSSPAMIYTSKPYGDLGSIFISENFKDILGYELRELLENPSFWIEHVHAEDRERIREEEIRVIKEGHGAYEYRFRHKDGSYRWMREEARLIRDAAGNPLEVIGYWIDITDLKRIEDELRERNEDIKSLNEGITQRLIQKISQIDNISALRDRLRKSPGVSTGFDLILDTALNDFQMDVGVVVIIDREENAVKVRDFKSRIEGMKVDESYPLNAGFAELEALRESSSVSKIVGQGELSILKTASIHCAPILFGKEVYGILALGSQKDLTLDDSDLAVLGMYSELTSTLFEIQKLTVVPVKEAGRAAKRRFELESGSSYLVENDIEKAFEVFVDNVFSGLEGLCITRQFPPKVRRKYGLEKTPIVWLTSERAEGEATVHSIQDLSILIASFLDNTERGVVLLDGLEYLITNHGFEILIRFLQTSRSRFEKKDAILIAALLEKALDAKEVTLIEREMKPLITK